MKFTCILLACTLILQGVRADKVHVQVIQIGEGCGRFSAEGYTQEFTPTQETTTAKDSLTTQEATTGQEIPTTQKTMTTQEFTTTQETTTAKDSLTTQETTTGQEIPTTQKTMTTQEFTTTRETTTAKDSLTTQETTTSQEIPTTQKTMTTQEFTTTQETTTAKDSLTTQETTTGQEIPTTQETMTTQEFTTTQETTTAKDSLTTQEATTGQEIPTTQKTMTTEEITTTQETTTTMETTTSLGLPCESPSHEIGGLGCIIPVYTRFTWPKAKHHCEDSLGGRLLQGITSQDQFDSLKQHFTSKVTQPRLKIFSAWIGLRNSTWLEGGGEGGDNYDPIIIPANSTLWAHEFGDPHGGKQECGHICLWCRSPRLRDYLCPTKWSSLCQRRE